MARYRIIVGMVSHCPSSCKWVPGGNTGEIKGGEERNWLPLIGVPQLVLIDFPYLS